MKDIFDYFDEPAPERDPHEHLEEVIAENRLEHLEHVTAVAVENVMFEEPDRALAIADRSLALAPAHPGLLLLRWNLRANAGDFDPAILADLVQRPQATSMRRRLYANLGVACLARQRIRDGLAALREAARDGHEMMRVDVGVISHGEPVWIQRMRTLLQLDGLGEHMTATWGIGATRMVVLLEGLATVSSESDAMLLRAEAAQRLERGRRERTPDPEQLDVTLENLLADAADYARVYGLEDVAIRLEQPAASA